MLLCIREDVPFLLLNSDVSTEGFFVELKLRKKKWLLCCSYNPHKNQISNHLKEIGRNIDAFSSNYDNLILLCDFNPTGKHMKDFSLIYNCKNIIRYKACYKNPENPKYIDLIMTNMPKSFQNSLAIETGLSDFHKICLTVLKVFCIKQKPDIQYRSFEKFSNEAFINDLRNTFFQFSCSWEMLERIRLPSLIKL